MLSPKLMAEAMEKIKASQYEPIAFDFTRVNEILAFGSKEVTREMLEEGNLKDVNTSTRGIEIAQTIIHHIKEQHAIHPLTPGELAVGFQISWVSLLTGSNNLSAQRLSATAAESVVELCKKMFQASCLEQIIQILKDDPSKGD